MDRARYQTTQVLRDGSDRRVELGIDRLSGREVILKTQDVAAACREARCLLSITGRATPRVLGFVGGGESRCATIVLEQVPGLPLSPTARPVHPDRLPGIVRDACIGLAHIHRAGWIHADLNPENILILEGGDDSLHVRLVDFGFALPRYGGMEEELERGGTVGYMAPELARGWLIDERTDLYSLGAVMRECLGGSPSGPEWAPILDRLLAPAVSRRFTGAVEARVAVESAFGLPPAAGHEPRLGAGPMRGREEILARCVDRLLNPSARILIQARPGIGMTRFLLEVALHVLERGGRAPEIVEPAQPTETPSLEGTLGYLKRVAEADGAVLCGVTDPSPGLHWLAPEWAARIRSVTGSDAWERIVLPPVSRTAFRDIIATSVGALDPEVERCSDRLYDRYEGDLRLSEQSLSTMLRSAGEERDLGWVLRPHASDGPIPENDGNPPPSLLDISLPARDALRICARAGSSLRRVLAEALLARFTPSTDLEYLLAYGYLVPEPQGRVGFITHRLWREAALDPIVGGSEVDAWLREHLAPDPDCMEEILGACGVAHRLGDHPWEAEWLASALEGASEQRRWDSVLRLLCHPGDPQGGWTVEGAEARIAALQGCLPAEWTMDRLRAIAGMALRAVDPRVGTAVLETAAASREWRAASRALLALADSVVDDPRNGAFSVYVDQLRAAASRDPHFPGIVAYFNARRALAHGDEAEAAEEASRAHKLLAGTGRIEALLSVQVYAATRFDAAPAEAISLLEDLLLRASDPELAAQLRYNLSRMLDELGRYDEALSHAEAGLASAGPSISPARILLLRIQRGWLWAHLGRSQEAAEEARALLGTARIRFVPVRRVTLRFLVGHCLVVRGHGLSGLRDLASAVRDATQHVPPSLRWEGINVLLDAILDLDAWDFARAHAEDFATDPRDVSPLAQATRARVRAIIAQGAGRLADARADLDEDLPATEALRDRLIAARYRHHAGCVCLALATEGHDRDAARTAISHQTASLALLPGSGLDYHRARILLRLAQAYHLIARRRDALTAIAQAISMARHLDARGLLADCLEARAEIEMSADGRRT